MKNKSRNISEQITYGSDGKPDPKVWEKIAPNLVDEKKRMKCDVQQSKKGIWYTRIPCPPKENKTETSTNNLPEWAKSKEYCLSKPFKTLEGGKSKTIWGISVGSQSVIGTTDIDITILNEDGTLTISTKKGKKFTGFWECFGEDRKSTRLNSSHMSESRMPSSA